MSNPDIVVSFVYVIYILAPAIRQELWLRVALFLTSVGFAIWGAMLGSTPVIFANILFCVLSVRQIHRAYTEQRPVNLSNDAANFGTNLFPGMSDHDLERLWKLGSTSSIDEGQLTLAGTPNNQLVAVLEGDIDVELSSGRTVERAAPAIIGEVSSLANAPQPATATVTVRNARVHRWAMTDLDELAKLHPSFSGPFVKGLSAQMVNRVAV